MTALPNGRIAINRSFYTFYSIIMQPGKEFLKLYLLMELMLLFNIIMHIL